MSRSEPSGATWAEVVQECGFKSETEAQRFAQTTLQKVRRRMQARGIYDYQAPERETVWDKLANN